MGDNLPGAALHLLITGLVGLAFSFVGQLVYPFLTESLWQPLGIALYFLAFSTVMYITLFVLNQVRHDYSFWVTHGRKDEWGGVYRRAALCIPLIFLMAGVLEFVYEVGNMQMGNPTSYVFVIDDSGSMSGNDPEQKRAAAIASFMAKEQFNAPYAVYGFTTDAYLIKGLSPYTTSDSFEFASDGGTDVLHSLDQVLADLSSGKLGNVGEAPRILLFSDGESSSFGWRRIAKDSRSSNAVVSTIGFGYDSSLLRNIAERTGGVFVQIDDIDSLQAEMEVAISSNASRNLISSRAAIRLDWLYALMRVLFLIIIGIIWSLMKFNAFCSSSGRLNNRVFVISIVLCATSSVLIELLFQYFWAPPAAVRMLFCVMWALTPGFFVANSPSVVSPQYRRSVPPSSGSLSGIDADTLIGSGDGATVEHRLGNIGADAVDAFDSGDVWSSADSESEAGEFNWNEDPFS